MSKSNRGKRRNRQIDELLARDGNLCWLCQQPFTENNQPTRDHVIPRCFGGKATPGNLRLAHAECNVKRGCSSAEITPQLFIQPAQSQGDFHE